MKQFLKDILKLNDAKVKMKYCIKFLVLKKAVSLEDI